jgi:hypothetical protein
MRSLTQRMSGSPDGALTRRPFGHQRAISPAGHAAAMTEDGVDAVIRRAIGGDAAAIAWIAANSEASDDATLLAMAALLGSQVSPLDRALTSAKSRRDRQIVAIARAHVDNEIDLVDALARDHLVDFPDSYIVAWLASGATVQRPTS